MGRRIASAAGFLLFLCAAAFAAWSNAGGGLDYHVYALLPFKGELFAAGNFFNAEGHASRFVARWNGTSWSPAGGGLTGSFAVTLAEFNGDLYAGGNLTNISPENPVTYVARWDGSDWHAAGNPGIINVASLCVFQNHLYAGGDGGLARLDDTVWTRLAALGQVTALAVFKNDLYLGNVQKIDGQDVNRVARWNGAAFSEVGGGVFDTSKFGDQVYNQASVGALAVYDSSLYVGGTFKTAGGKPARNVARWDGSAWTSLGDGVDLPVLALSAVDGKLFAAGLFTHAGALSVKGLAAWDGDAWSDPAPGLGTGGSALAYYDGSLYCGGTFMDPAWKGVARWTGSAAVLPMAKASGRWDAAWRAIFRGRNALGRTP